MPLLLVRVLAAGQGRGQGRGDGRRVTDCVCSVLGPCRCRRSPAQPLPGLDPSALPLPFFPLRHSHASTCSPLLIATQRRPRPTSTLGGNKQHADLVSPGPPRWRRRRRGRRRHRRPLRRRRRRRRRRQEKAISPPRGLTEAAPAHHDQRSSSSSISDATRARPTPRQSLSCSPIRNNSTGRGGDPFLGRRTSSSSRPPPRPQQPWPGAPPWPRQ